jgi:hypothetical protein
MSTLIRCPTCKAPRRVEAGEARVDTGGGYYEGPQLVVQCRCGELLWVYGTNPVIPRKATT